MKILIIVESPAKAQTIQKILGNDEYIVKSSFGHIRNLCCKSYNSLGIDVDDNYKPRYVKIGSRSKQINELETLSRSSSKVILASDEDREGEAIAWHLCKVLKLDEKKTDRIVFHEITKKAIEEALKEPRKVDMNMVHAQQARQIVDKLVGFEISPILCKKIRSSLSAGRVQSVCMKMIIEREENIDKFESKITFKSDGHFYPKEGNLKSKKITGNLNKHFDEKDTTQVFLNDCIKSTFKINNISKEHKKKNAPVPFTTSSLQQEVGKKFMLPAKKIMAIAQLLYENGYITYHRTDSLNLSNQVTNSIKKHVIDKYGEKYHKFRTFKTKSKGAQEAHEAIRPTKIERTFIDNLGNHEKNVYEMIWKRTVASQMAPMEYNEYKMTIDISNRKEDFIAKGEEILFEGYRKIYDYEMKKGNKIDIELFKESNVNDELEYHKIISTETHSKAQGRYSEPSLIKKMEDYGIGRPSTYASTMATIQDRGYVKKKTTKGKEVECATLTLENDKINESKKKTKLEVEKNKLFPTDTGKIVNTYLNENFSNIMEYNFTADFEKELDKVFNGDKEWTQTVDKYYKSFHPKVEELRKSSPDLKSTKTKRYVGIDKSSNEKMYVYVAKFGPVIQIGEDDSKTKPRYVGLDDSINLETITEEEANKYTAFPKVLGQHEGKDVIVKKGRYGYYLSHDNQNYKFKDGMNQYLSLEDALKCMEGTVKTKVLKQFNKTSAIKSGQYGPYIQIGKKIASLPKKYDSEEEIEKLDLATCKEIVELKSKTPSKKKYVKKK